MAAVLMLLVGGCSTDDPTAPRDRMIETRSASPAITITGHRQMRAAMPTNDQFRARIGEEASIVRCPGAKVCAKGGRGAMAWADLRGDEGVAEANWTMTVSAYDDPESARVAFDRTIRTELSAREPDFDLPLEELGEGSYQPGERGTGDVSRGEVAALPAATLREEFAYVYPDEIGTLRSRAQVVVLVDRATVSCDMSRAGRELVDELAHACRAEITDLVQRLAAEAG